MDVILLERIRKLGELGDQVKVKPGYGRNYLIPQGKAVVASGENIARFEARRAELERTQADALTSATARAEKLNTLEITIARKAGAEGKLFGSVNSADIASTVTEAGVVLNKQEVRLPDGPFRMLGDYDVDLHLYTEVDATITLHVVAEGD